MKIRINRYEAPQEVKQVVIYINDERYTCREFLGGLNITKISDGESDAINVRPILSNVIDIS